MKAARKIKQLPDKVKRQLTAVLLLACLAATFAVPAFGGGYNILKTEKISSSAAVTDVDLLLVASSAFGEARKVMNSTDPDAQTQFIKNMNILVGGNSGYKWQNMGLLLGPKDALSGSTWNTFQNPTTLSLSEVQNYMQFAETNGFSATGLETAYNKYKAFGYAVKSLNTKAKKSHSSTVSTNEGLDSMSSAALKLGNFGVKFLNDYNPAPVVLSLYDSSNLSTYSDNKLVKIVKSNTIMKEVITLFGDKVGNTGLSFFILLNAVIAVLGLALSLLLSLMGNQSIGDGIRKFLIRIVIGTVGMYLVGNFMSVLLNHVTDTVLNVEAAEDVSYIEKNLNLYDWYLTGFSLPADTTLTIDSSGQFQFSAETIRSINEFTYQRLTGKSVSAKKIRTRMENYTENENSVIASFVTPTYTSTKDGEESGEAWATDVYYKVMENFAANNDLADNDATGSETFSIFSSRYFWMSGLTMTKNGSSYDCTMSSSSYTSNYYGLNPISAFNLLRTEFSGDNITATSTVYPSLAYVAYDAVNVKDSSSEGSRMNSVLRFIAIFTIIMAALKGMITIFTAGFGGILSGGIKTATGSSYGLGQALGGVIAILCGLIGISLILSVTMTLLEALYGIAYELISGGEIVDAILEPIEDAVGDIPLIGSIIMGMCEGIVSFLLTLIFSLTFPKLGAIPINVFCQFMADIPGKIAERAQMLEGMLLTGRSSAGGGPGPRGGGGGAYGRMASAQASQAFGNAQRQAVGVISGVAGAAAALTGMGLSAAGKALNKKGDSMEGKPKNPGMDGWDEMSPEQQAAAASAAEEMGEDWDNMDQDAREKAMEERMEAQEANAQESSGTEGENPDAENMDMDGADSVSGTELDGEDAGPDAGSEDMSDGSIAAGMEGAEEAGGEPPAAEDLDGGSVNGESDGDTPDVSEPDADQSIGGEQAGEDNVTNNNNEQESLNMEQKVNNDIKADADERNVDNSSINEEGENGLDNATDKDGNPIGKDNDGMKGADGADKKFGDKTPDGSGSMSTNIQNNQTAETKNATTANKNTQQVDKSKSTTMNTGGKGTGQGTSGKTPGSTTQGQTPGAQGMNGTSKSAWDKDMTVADQRKARAVHAAGDALQMMGGNRTVGDGLKDAAGHLKDAAVAYTVSDDVLPTLTSSVRERRRARDARMRRNNQNNNGVNQ